MFSTPHVKCQYYELLQSTNTVHIHLYEVRTVDLMTSGKS